MTPFQRLRATRHSIREFCKRKGLPLAGWLLREYQDQREYARNLIAKIRIECSR